MPRNTIILKPKVGENYVLNCCHRSLTLNAVIITGTPPVEHPYCYSTSLNRTRRKFGWSWSVVVPVLLLLHGSVGGLRVVFTSKLQTSTSAFNHNTPINTVHVNNVFFFFFFFLIFFTCRFTPQQVSE